MTRAPSLPSSTEQICVRLCRYTFHGEDKKRGSGRQSVGFSVHLIPLEFNFGYMVRTPLCRILQYSSCACLTVDIGFTVCLGFVVYVVVDIADVVVVLLVVEWKASRSPPTKDSLHVCSIPQTSYAGLLFEI